MTRQDHLLIILAEECAEVAQRASKALRFGISETQPGQPFTNADRLTQEMGDLVGVYLIMVNEGIVRYLSDMGIIYKKEKVKRFIGYSTRLGTLMEEVKSK